MTHAHPDPVLAFEARQDARDARAQAKARAQGITHCRCDDCGEVRGLSWLGAECNNGDGLSWACEGTYRPHRLH